MIQTKPATTAADRQISRYQFSVVRSAGAAPIPVSELASSEAEAEQQLRRHYLYDGIGWESYQLQRRSWHVKDEGWKSQSLPKRLVVTNGALP